MFPCGGSVGGKRGKGVVCVSSVSLRWQSLCCVMELEPHHNVVMERDESVCHVLSALIVGSHNAIDPISIWWRRNEAKHMGVQCGSEQSESRGLRHPTIVVQVRRRCTEVLNALGREDIAPEGLHCRPCATPYGYGLPRQRAKRRGGRLANPGRKGIISGDQLESLKVTLTSHSLLPPFSHSPTLAFLLGCPPYPLVESHAPF